MFAKLAFVETKQFAQWKIIAIGVLVLQDTSLIHHLRSDAHNLGMAKSAMLVNVNSLVSPINNVLMVRLARVDFALMDVLTTMIALDSTCVFNQDVLILVLLAKLVVPTADVRPRTKLSIVLVHLVLLVCQLPFKDVSGFPTNAPVKLVPMATNVSQATACLVAASMVTAPRVNNVSMECA